MINQKANKHVWNAFGAVQGPAPCTETASAGETQPETEGTGDPLQCSAPLGPPWHRCQPLTPVNCSQAAAPQCWEPAGPRCWETKSTVGTQTPQSNRSSASQFHSHPFGTSRTTSTRAWLHIEPGARCPTQRHRQPVGRPRVAVGLRTPRPGLPAPTGLCLSQRCRDRRPLPPHALAPLLPAPAPAAPQLLALHRHVGTAPAPRSHGFVPRFATLGTHPCHHGPVPPRHAPSPTPRALRQPRCHPWCQAPNPTPRLHSPPAHSPVPTSAAPCRTGSGLWGCIPTLMGPLHPRRTLPRPSTSPAATLSRGTVKVKVSAAKPGWQGAASSHLRPPTCPDRGVSVATATPSPPVPSSPFQSPPVPSPSPGAAAAAGGSRGGPWSPAAAP